MKKFFIVTALLLINHSITFAKIRRVGFFGNPIANTDYSSFALAYTAASAGDTILMFPSTTINAAISKKLILIGPGNWLDATSTPKGNANEQAFAGEASAGTVTFSSGSDGSVLTGFHTGTIFPFANNITIARNRDLTIYITPSTAITVTNLQVLQNYNVGINGNYANTGSSITNMNISNNLLTYFITLSGNTYNGNISNNVWAYDATLTTAANGGSSTYSSTYGIDLGGGAYLLQNNIFECYTNASAPSNANYFTFSNGGNSVFNYNLALQSSTAQAWGVGIGNVTTPIANASSLFLAFPAIGTTSADARFQLAAGSPALTVGAGGTPIGMFAGTSPYKLSTIPSIPSVYLLSSPQGNNPSGSTIQINVSTRGNN